MIPLQGGSFGLGALRVPGYRAEDGSEVIRADWDVISPTYFQVLGIPMREGRAFDAADRDGRPHVAIVNETFARRAWPEGQAVGRVIHQATARNRFDRPLTVVGVARDTRHRSVHEPARPFIYVPHAQQPMTELNFYVRSPGPPPALTELARVIAEVEPALPVIGSQSFADATSLGLLPQQLAASLAGVVAVLGLLLSAMGLYGVMTYQAVMRAREMAVRRALGATDAHVWRLTLGQGMAVATGGVVVGMLLAGGAAMGIRSVLVGVTPLDPVAFAAAGLGLSVVAALACALPARRAVRSNPASLLRAE
jgi:putative ABC transport system permease protein